MAQPVAGVGIAVVRLIGHPKLSQSLADRLCLGTGQPQQGPQVRPPHRADACRPMQSGPPRQPEQQRFCLVSSSMGRCYPVYPLGKLALKMSIPQLACPILAGIVRHSLFRRTEHLQRHPQPGTFGPDKGFVPVCCLPPQPMVHMAGGELKAHLRLHQQQQPQQRHAVCPAGHRCRHPQPCQLLAAAEPRRLRQGIGQDILRTAHQRLKSTSIKRVWAPSQPRGTVLVSPWRFFATMHSAVSASTSEPSGFWLA